MTPYRSREEPRAPKRAPRTGLVTDMVRQFADVFAFVRELVQNGIDAGATAIEVTVDRGADAVTSVRVTDDGCGMTLEIIESALLVLFRSTKDEDPTKIGKYGVGFMSVLAVDPVEVTIDTWRGGHAHRVRLYPDHSYEIERSTPREGHGTIVAVSKVVAPEAFEAHWQDVAASLHRWCRHAELPIWFTLLDGVSAEPRRARADRPFGVRAAISVHSSYPDGMEVVVGPLAGSGELPEAGSGEDRPAPFAGFYNRGLTLHETTAPLDDDLAHVRFKVKSPLLRHTLSRDDVRRDQAFHLGLARAKALAKNELCRAVTEAIAKEARAAAEGGEAASLSALVDVALSPPVSGGAFDVPLPLAHPILGQATMTAREVRLRCGRVIDRERPLVAVTARRTELTEALARHGIPVVWAMRTAVVKAIEGAGVGLSAAAIEGECHVGRELSGDERRMGDDSLCARLGEALAAAGVGRVAIGRFIGSPPPLGILVEGADPRAIEHVAPASAAVLSRHRWPKGALLLLDAGAEAVDCARRATSPAIAAHLLARLILLSGTGLTAKLGEALAVRALEEAR